MRDAKRAQGDDRSASRPWLQVRGGARGIGKGRHVVNEQGSDETVETKKSVAQIRC
jgi:hypothetical protein